QPGARRRIAHAVLLGQGQGNATLLQIGFPTTARQGSLGGGGARGAVRPRRGGRTGCWWVCRCLAHCCCGALPLCPLSARWRPWKGRLALLLLAPLRPRRFHIAPGTAGKTNRS